MRKICTLACLAAIALTGTVFTACSSDNLEENSPNLVFDENGTAGVKPEFVISIPRSVVGTRMTNAVTQNQGTVAQFRGLDNIRLISFSEEPGTSSTKLSDILRLSAIDVLNSVGSLNYKVYADQFVPVGTTNFLFYAKAIDAAAEEPITTMDQKFHYGILNATGLTNEDFRSPSSITFSLEPINTTPDRQAGNAAGRNIVTLLTSLATTTASGVAAPNDKWSTTTHKTLAPLYKNFIAITTSSTKSVSILLSDLYNSLRRIQTEDPGYVMAQALLAKIDAAIAPGTSVISGTPLTLKSEYQGYPSSIGLPDGAARVRWNASGVNSNSFLDVTANYNLNNRITMLEYVYPAALWYYTSTPLKASAELESPEYPDAGNWEGVINGVYANASDVVNDNTQSVALQKQAEYGVGRVETKITMPSGIFYDAKGETVTTGSGYTLTGFLLGGQNSVDYLFTSKGNENMTIYDREMASDNITVKPDYTTTANQTLALETKSNQVIYAALELTNGGEAFMGADGIIPAGGTFYLTAKLDPTTASNYELGVLDKIVMQDHVTKLTVTIKNGSTVADRNGDGVPDEYVKDGDGNPIGVDTDGDGTVDPYDIDGDGTDDTFITDPDHGGPGWDTDGDGEVDRPVTPDEDGNYPDTPSVPEGLGTATNGVPDLSSPGIELGTSVNLEWQEGLILTPSI